METDMRMPNFDPPASRPVTPLEQARQIVTALQEEGLTGVVPRGDILHRYPEHCWMLGFVPLNTNDLFKALAKVVKRVRPLTGPTKRVTCYVIPPSRAATAAAWPKGEQWASLPDGANIVKLTSARPSRRELSAVIRSRQKWAA